jgi:aspartate aminotransferase
VLADELYENIIFDGRKKISLGSVEAIKDYVITINGFSKSYAMTGWRLGYSVAHRDLTRSMLKLQEGTVTTSCSFVQKGALTALDCSSETSLMAAEYQKSRDFLVKNLNSIDSISCPSPEGAFYLFFRIANGMNSFELSDFLLERARILVAPGGLFGLGGEPYIRLSFATSMQNLEQAVERIAGALH